MFKNCFADTMTVYADMEKNFMNIRMKLQTTVGQLMIRTTSPYGSLSQGVRRVLTVQVHA